MSKQELIDELIASKKFRGYELGDIGIEQVCDDVAGLMLPLTTKVTELEAEIGVQERWIPTLQRVIASLRADKEAMQKVVDEAIYLLDGNAMSIGEMANRAFQFCKYARALKDKPTGGDDE